LVTAETPGVEKLWISCLLKDGAERRERLHPVASVCAAGKEPVAPEVDLLRRRGGRLRDNPQASPRRRVRSVENLWGRANFPK
jgi:hypothetical protein